MYAMYFSLEVWNRLEELLSFMSEMSKECCAENFDKKSISTLGIQRQKMYTSYIHRSLRTKKTYRFKSRPLDSTISARIDFCEIESFWNVIAQYILYSYH